MPTLRTGAAGFGGALGYSLIRSRRRKTKPKSRPPRVILTFPQPVPSADDLALATAGFTGGVGGYDINSDPAVAAARGLAAKMRAQAQATALAKRRQAAIEFGDPTGIEGIDEETARKARENPFSILKNLEYGYTTGLEGLEEGLNAANLFYSGYRSKQLAEAARRYQQARYDASTQFRGLMSDINEQLANALLNADIMEAQAALGSSGGGYDYDYTGSSGDAFPLGPQGLDTSRLGLSARQVRQAVGKTFAPSARKSPARPAAGSGGALGFALMRQRRNRRAGAAGFGGALGGSYTRGGGY